MHGNFVRSKKTLPQVRILGKRTAAPGRGRADASRFHHCGGPLPAGKEAGGRGLWHYLSGHGPEGRNPCGGEGIFPRRAGLPGRKRSDCKGRGTGGFCPGHGRVSAGSFPSVPFFQNGGHRMLPGLSGREPDGLSGDGICGRGKSETDPCPAGEALFPAGSPGADETRFARGGRDAPKKRAAPGYQSGKPDFKTGRDADPHRLRGRPGI